MGRLYFVAIATVWVDSSLKADACRASCLHEAGLGSQNQKRPPPRTSCEPCSQSLDRLVALSSLCRSRKVCGVGDEGNEKATAGHMQ